MVPEYFAVLNQNSATDVHAPLLGAKPGEVDLSSFAKVKATVF